MVIAILLAYHPLFEGLILIQAALPYTSQLCRFAGVRVEDDAATECTPRSFVLSKATRPQQSLH